jgi:hypothetical protein
MTLCFGHCHILINGDTNACQVSSLWEAIIKKKYLSLIQEGDLNKPKGNDLHV